MEKKLRVILVVPNFRWTDSDVNALWHYIPYNLCLLAAMIEPLCDVQIVDAHKRDMTHEQFRDILRALAPDVVGITVLMDQYAYSGHKAAAIVKTVDPSIKVLLGGVYATMNPQKAIEDKNIDYVVIGEGEYLLQKMIRFFQGEAPLPDKGICFRVDTDIENRGMGEYIADLDKLPLPAYHLIDYSSYANNVERKSVDMPPELPFARVITSRGCPYGCIFCQVESIAGKKFRGRSAGHVLDEIEFLKRTYGIKSLVFDDDNLFTVRERACAIFQGMIDRKLVMPWVAIAVAVFRLDEDLIKLMKASGCQYIDVAIESGNKRVLTEIIGKPVDYEYAKKMVRAAQKEGLYVAANFVIGFPTETWEEIRETIKFAEELGVDYMKLFTAIPLRNTRLWDLAERTGAFRPGFSEVHRRWSSGQLETKDFSADDLTILRAYEWDRINFVDPEKRRRTAKMMGITEEELMQIRRRTLKDARRTLVEEARTSEENAG